MPMHEGKKVLAFGRRDREDFDLGGRLLRQLLQPSCQVAFSGGADDPGLVHHIGAGIADRDLRLRGAPRQNQSGNNAGQKCQTRDATRHRRPSVRRPHRRTGS